MTILVVPDCTAIVLMVVVGAGGTREVLLVPEVRDNPEAELVRPPPPAPSLSDIPGVGEVAEPPPVSDMLRFSGSAHLALLM